MEIIRNRESYSYNQKEKFLVYMRKDGLDIMKLKEAASNQLNRFVCINYTTEIIKNLQRSRFLRAIIDSSF